MSRNPLSAVAGAAFVALAFAGAASAQTAPAAPKVEAPKVEPHKVEPHKAASSIPAVKFEEIVGKPAASSYSLTAIAIGAVAGVLAVNWLAPALGYTVLASAAAEAPVTAAGLETALAASRVTAISSAILGGVAGQIVAGGLH